MATVTNPLANVLKARVLADMQPDAPRVTYEVTLYTIVKIPP